MEIPNTIEPLPIHYEMLESDHFMKDVHKRIVDKLRRESNEAVTLCKTLLAVGQIA